MSLTYFAPSDDPVADWEDYNEMLESRPEYEAYKCEWCGEPLDKLGWQYCIETDVHELICENCSYQYWERKRKEWERPRLRCIPYREK